MPSKPYIGITTSYENHTQQVHHSYIQAIEQAGGIPVIIPMLDDEDNARQLASILDGLVMTGGPGITRGLIGDLPDDLPPVDVVRDTSDQLIYEATQHQPILGICYGMQFINAMHGGTIYADLMAQLDGVHAHSPKRGAQPHPVQIVQESHFAKIMQQASMTVNTYHVQAIAQLGKGLTRNAISHDGIIEGFESDDGRLLGLQFHPERMYDTMAPLFIDFVQRCAHQRT